MASLPLRTEVRAKDIYLYWADDLSEAESYTMGSGQQVSSMPCG